MGKMINMIVTLIMIDLMFLITAQQAINSPGSAILSLLFNPEQLLNATWWLSFFSLGSGNIWGVVGIGVAGATIAVASFARNADLAAFAGATSILALTLTEFIPIYTFLADKNQIMATLIVSPMIIMGALISIEWLRNKD